MKLTLKIFVFLFTLIMINSTNLKLFKNLDNKNIYFTDFEDDKSKVLINKFFSIPNNSTSTFNLINLLQDIGDKTFICVILLYFNSSGFYLFFSTLIMKILYSNTKHFLYERFISEFFLFKIIFPVKIFQFLGIIFYQLCGYSILFKIIFRKNDTSYKKIETEDLKETFSFQEKLKLIFIILFSLFSSFSLDENYIEKDTSNFTINNFLINLSSVVLSLLLAHGIGHFIFKRFSKESTLIVSSITFLLLSIDGAIKLFSY